MERVCKIFVGQPFKVPLLSYGEVHYFQESGQYFKEMEGSP